MLQVMEPPSKEVIEKVRSEFGLNEQRVREAIEHLKNWLELQPHLPKEIDDDRLERWLIRCKNSTEKVKKTLDMYYTLRTNIPEAMTGWDTKADWFKHASSSFCYFPMPHLTSECDRIVFAAFLTSDSTYFNLLDAIKLSQLVMEIKISEDYCCSDIHVIDYANFSFGHVTKVTPSAVKKYELCVINGYNARVKAMHILNAPPYADAVISMAKRMVKSKLAQRIHVHGSDLTSFYKQVPKEILPTEYGGKSGTVAENWDLWKKKLESYRDIYLERENHRSDESKRPGRSISSSELLGFEGSFRQLNVD